MKLVRSILLTFAGGIAIYGALAVFVPAKASADAPNCCNYGEDCPGSQHCFYPGRGEADCSANKPNYCGDAALE